MIGGLDMFLLGNRMECLLAPVNEWKSTQISIAVLKNITRNRVLVKSVDYW